MAMFNMKTREFFVTHEEFSKPSEAESLKSKEDALKQELKSVQQKLSQVKTKCTTHSWGGVLYIKGTNTDTSQKLSWLTSSGDAWVRKCSCCGLTQTTSNLHYLKDNLTGMLHTEVDWHGAKEQNSFV